MFEDWPLFKVELTRNFGPTKPIADAESAINKLSLTEDGKAIYKSKCKDGGLEWDNIYLG